MPDESAAGFEVWLILPGGDEIYITTTQPQEVAFLEAGVRLKSLGAMAIAAQNVFDFHGKFGIKLTSPGIPCYTVVVGAILTDYDEIKGVHEPLPEGVQTELMSAANGVPE